MRKNNSLFDQVCNYINSQEIGSTFTVHNLYNSVNENYTPWKRGYRDPNYVTRLYCGYLRHAGVLSKNKRGTWTVLAKIPDGVNTFNVYGIGYNKRWHATKNNFLSNPTQFASQVDNTVKSQIEAPGKIIIYFIIDKHVEPKEVWKTHAAALISTGNYFEDEMDAWYFLSVGSGVAVESLKADWKKTQDAANQIIEITKDAEAEAKAKRIYTIKVRDFLYGHYKNQEVVETLMKQYKDIIKDMHEDGDVDPEMVFESIIEEEEEAAELRVAIETKKLITLEDIRGREVYFKNNSNVWNKATVLGVQMEALHMGVPTFTNIHVKLNTNETKWITYSTIKFSKEEVLNSVTVQINSL